MKIEMYRGSLDASFRLTAVIPSVIPTLAKSSVGLALLFPMGKRGEG